MNRKETNRAKQLPIEQQYLKGVKLIDVDTTIAMYMADVIIPNLEEQGNLVKVPLVYGNAERWEGARKNGYLRDQRGKLQIPIIMFKRNSLERDSTMQHFREGTSMSAYKKYSTKNRYERFSLQNRAQPAYELYNVAVPAYVNITYEVMIWTSFTEHMNKIVEAFQYASDRYWGKEDNFKFRTRIDSFDTQQEIGEGSERIIRTSFTMTTNAYLVPETFNEKPVTQKSFTPKRVLWGIETDLTGTTGELFTSPSLYNEYSAVIDFVAVRGSQMATFVNSSTAKLTGVKKPILPSELIGVFDVVNWFRIYINGDFISPSSYTYTYDGLNKEIIFTFTLPYPLDVDDEIAITGKFQEL